MAPETTNTTKKTASAPVIPELKVTNAEFRSYDGGDGECAPVAFANIEVNNVMILKNVKIAKSKRSNAKYFISNSSKKAKNGKYYQDYYPVSDLNKAQFEAGVLAAYDAFLANKEA